MKKLLIGISVILFFWGITGIANATLWDRGGGLIYDDDLDLTLLQDVYFAGQLYSYGGGQQWTSNLEYYDSVRNVTYTDWRLPKADPAYGFGTNIITSELGHIWYTELGNTAGGPPSNNGPFISSWQWGFATLFWNAEEFNSYYDGAYDFWWNNGAQSATGKSSIGLIWAVRDGDVAAPVPEPATMFLFGSGLVGLAGFKRRHRKK